MPLPPFLLDRLCCPISRQPVALVPPLIQETILGSLSPQQRSQGWHPAPEQLLHTLDWQHLYRVEQGVPAMRPDQCLRLDVLQREKLASFLVLLPQV